MKLGTKGRYAVMALVDLANSPVDQPKTLAEIAENQFEATEFLEILVYTVNNMGKFL